MRKQNRQIERAGAMSFADVTEHQRNCYSYTHADLKAVFSAEYQALLNHYLAEVKELEPLKHIKEKYHSIAIRVALEELHYPNTSQTKQYAWSMNQRASASFRCGQRVAKSTWLDNNLCKITEHVIDDVIKQSKIVSAKIKNNLSDIR